jgi:hypothetical protein
LDRFAEAFSFADIEDHAFAGRYLLTDFLPGFRLGLPSLVFQSCFVHLARLFDEDFFPRYPPPAFLYRAVASCAFLADQTPEGPPLLPDLTEATIRFHNEGFDLVEVVFAISHARDRIDEGLLEGVEYPEEKNHEGDPNGEFFIHRRIDPTRFRSLRTPRTTNPKSRA